MEHDTEMTIV